MSDLLKLHNEAMDLALLGDKELELGNKEGACNYYFQAFEKEKEVAFMAEKMGNPEPGLSILFRSSASLALQCGKLREAERLIAHALAGNPTNEIAVELRNMLQIIYSSPEFNEEENPSEIPYKLSIPKSEDTLFTTIVKRMGWTAESLRNMVGKIAVL